MAYNDLKGYNENKAKASRWISRWNLATEYFEKWERKHNCKQLAEYYEGMQYNPGSYPDGMDPLVFNLFYSAVEARLPMMAFQNPIAQIKPKPGKMDYEPDLALLEANLRTDMVNTFITAEESGFADACESAVLDAQFYFGLVEVGYSAEWVINPSALKPVLKSDETDDILGVKRNAIKDKQPEELPEEERIYIKHIPPTDFRIGGNDKWRTEQSSWCGYREFFRKEDLLALPEFAKILEQEDEDAGSQSGDFVPSGTDDAYGSDLMECYTIFDIRRRLKLIISKTHSCVLLEQSFQRLPLFPLRYSKPAVEHGWLPIPPAKSWKSPQDEYNESKRFKQAYRHRALPKWVASINAFSDEEEMNKLSSPVPFTISQTSLGDAAQALYPVPYPSLPGEFDKSLAASREEFMFAAGTSVDVTNSADRETATKSKIVATRAAVRESRMQTITGNWMGSLVKEISMLQAERLTKPVWIERTIDAEPTFGEMQDFEKSWKQIDPTTHLTGRFGYSASVNLSALSPVTREEEKNSLLEFLAVLNQYPQFSFSPKLIRFLAGMLNLRIETVIKELQQMALVAQLGMAAKAQESGMGESAMAQRTVAQATPNTNEQITNQLENQVGLPQ